MGPLTPLDAGCSESLLTDAVIYFFPITDAAKRDSPGGCRPRGWGSGASPRRWSWTTSCSPLVRARPAPCSVFFVLCLCFLLFSSSFSFFFSFLFFFFLKCCTSFIGLGFVVGLHARVLPRATSSLTWGVLLALFALVALVCLLVHLVPLCFFCACCYSFSSSLLLFFISSLFCFFLFLPAFLSSLLLSSPSCSSS